MGTPYQLCVADLMTLEPIVVRDTDSVGFAETILRDFRISGVPVVDEEGVLVGVFSQTDVLHLQQPSVSALIRHREQPIRVGEVMSSPALTVSTLASLPAAASLMADEGVHRVVATDDYGRPIGVLSAMDFVRLAAERAPAYVGGTN